MRPAAVAGLFYPGERAALGAELQAFLAGVEPGEPRICAPKAIVVPHAGYIYSGRVAAAAYDAVCAGRGQIARVVLLGPVHRVPVRGIALAAADAFETPLGRVPVDREALGVLRGLPQVRVSAAAHAPEHSLEVQLPFLQAVLGDFALVPLAVGDASVEEVAEVIERLWGGPETLVVVSTDLSHYLDYETARRVDAATLARIAACATDIGHEEACGATPLNGLLAVARRRGLAVRLLAACNSGDTAGGRARVVGYAAFALEEPGAPGREAAGRALLAIARGAIEEALGFGARLEDAAAPWLRRHGATFVTLLREGRLRGCMGSLAPERALWEDVAENARAAAFRDPRFPRLSRAEWPGCTLEVSLLSSARPIAFADEAELFARVRPGEDGIILEYEGRRATFLPQVWESVPDPRRFFAELARKAGIAEGTRLARCRVLRYRVAKWTEAAFA
ncbi:MAG: AmmeMemoRadiSam system protein B [Burkholderiales bacterium]|nr:AmmeMemoRadiSam system protein B [Burkholderiales bacterium]